MADKEPVFSVDQTVEMMCSSCDSEQPHKVRSVTKQGKMTMASCEVCETVNTFSRGVKTSVSVAGGKTASPYDRTRRYKKSQAMMHEKFGHGEVTAVIEPCKIDVLFGDKTRRLLHDQS